MTGVHNYVLNQRFRILLPQRKSRYRNQSDMRKSRNSRFGSSISISAQIGTEITCVRAINENVTYSMIGGNGVRVQH